MSRLRTGPSHLDLQEKGVLREESVKMQVEPKFYRVLKAFFLSFAGWEGVAVRLLLYSGSTGEESSIIWRSQ